MPEHSTSYFYTQCEESLLLLQAEDAQYETDVSQ